MTTNGYLREELVLNAQRSVQLDTEEDFKTYNRRTCDCEKPMVWRSAMPMVGTGVLLRLCCLAKEVERMAGLPPGTFYQVFDFTPSWEWDCDQVSQTDATLPDGTHVIREYRQASPPLWIEERLVKKGLPIHNQMPGDKRKPVLLKQWYVDKQGRRREMNVSVQDTSSPTPV